MPKPRFLKTLGAVVQVRSAWGYITEGREFRGSVFRVLGFPKKVSAFTITIAKGSV